jgi:hypothetical protein
MEDVKTVTSQCRTCAEIKPQFFRPKNPPLIKALNPFDRISIDFKGPIGSTNQNKYLLVIVDEYSRFPFAYPCKDMTSSTVIKHLQNLFSVFGTPGYIHSDRGPGFISNELKDYLISLRVPFSNSSAYNPRGNGQVERYNGIIWKGVQLALHSKGLSINHWESVLPAVLHSIRTLICTSTNESPHQRFLSFQRRTVTGPALPPWVHVDSKALVKKHVRTSKYDPWVEECEIVHATPNYAQIKTANGKEQTVSLRDLAPLPTSTGPSDNLADSREPPPLKHPAFEIPETHLNVPEPQNYSDSNSVPPSSVPNVLTPPDTGNSESSTPVPLRRSSRNANPVERLNYDKLGGSK